MLYVITICSSIGAVDVEGRTWRIIDFPCTEESWRGHAVCGSPFFDTGAGLIDLSQGKLHLANNYDVTGDQLAIWALEDNNSKEWTLKHTVSFRHLLKHVQFGFHEFIVVAMHPDRNMVFFVFAHESLMSYDMDSGEVRMISNLEQSCYESYIPYVPLFSESLADGQQ
ncbi:hypothetical protein QOZ80_5AG0391460 [Eleusine coracana subsp. coracana]|nr:hypothetical protein QOZ80_5AG0391460 [Eleusine coracana subsp. coracana]